MSCQRSPKRLRHERHYQQRLSQPRQRLSHSAETGQLIRVRRPLPQLDSKPGAAVTQFSDTGQKPSVASEVADQPKLGIELNELAPLPVRVLRVHPTRFCYTGDAHPSAPGGIAAIYKDLAADDIRTSQVAADVAEARCR